MAAKGGAKKAGRSKDKCVRYKNAHTREKNKIRRVLRSSGRVAAEGYAAKYGMVGYLSQVIARKEAVRNG